MDFLVKDVIEEMIKMNNRNNQRLRSYKREIEKLEKSFNSVFKSEVKNDSRTKIGKNS